MKYNSRRYCTEEVRNAVCSQVVSPNLFQIYDECTVLIAVCPEEVNKVIYEEYHIYYAQENTPRRTTIEVAPKRNTDLKGNDKHKDDCQSYYYRIPVFHPIVFWENYPSQVFNNSV